MFITAMFKVSNAQKSLKIQQSKHLPEGGWLNKQQNILTTKFYAAVKKEEGGTCMWDGCDGLLHVKNSGCRTVCIVSLHFCTTI